jgi:uncharacterized protein with HEPN domain
MQKDNLVYVGHMLDMCRKVADKLKGKKRAEYDQDENLRMAIAHIIQTIGEAARNVTEEYKKSHPQVPWTKVIGMRHKVVHDYMEVDYDIVWDVATVELPALEKPLSAMLSADGT